VAAEEPEAWRRLFDGAEMETLIHAGGVCDVARCQDDPAFAWRINVDGVRALLDALPSSARLIYCSSDHVFGGRPEPYLEDAPPEPVSSYGRTRVAAEHLVREHDARHLVVRVGLPIGPSPGNRVGHLDWLRYRHGRGLPMTLIADEHRSAVRADDAADRILDLAQADAAGIRHVAAPAMSRPALARRLARDLGIDPRFELRRRADLPIPHLGRVELGSTWTPALGPP
jgi:dTDP-4-dehydrorhamnose reductase